MCLAYFIVFEIANIKQAINKSFKTKIKVSEQACSITNKVSCSIILSLFSKAHRGHQQTFEIAKNSRERERVVPVELQSSSMGKKFLRGESSN